MYPTVVIVLVETQRSMADFCEISPSIAIRLKGPTASQARPATSGRFSFAVGPVYNTMTYELESQPSRTVQNPGGQEHGLKEVVLEEKESQGGTIG